jgi:hypothetical protein
MKLKQRLQDICSKIRFSSKTAPFALLVVMTLTFGLFIPALGFYWDDWPIVFLGHTHGNFWQYYLSDRPLMAWPEIVFLALAGENPLIWQVLSLVVRAATVVCFWWCLTLVWPRAKRQVFCVACLFAVYPVFIQQPLAITYKSHFTAYLLYMVSVGLMLLAIRKPRWFYQLTLLSLIVGVVQLVTMEYFWGLELLRPILIWIVFSEKPDSRRQRLKKTFLNWLPYLLLFFGVVVWRFFILNLEFDRNSPKMLLSLFQSPVQSIGKLLLTVIRDSLYIVVSNWLAAVQPQTIDAKSPILLASWIFAILISVLVGFYLSRTYADDSSQEDQSLAWVRQALWVGIFALLAGMIPVWMTGRQESVGTYSDRLAIPAMVGASILVTGILFALLSKWSHKVLILAILVGLAAGVHFRTANDYRWDWTNQKRFFWQLYWRAPALKPDTAFLSEGGIFKWVTKYSLATAINTLYPVPNGTTDLPYWAFELDDVYNTDQLMQGVELSAKLRSLSFAAPSRNSIVISYDPYNKYSSSVHCLWVLSTEDASAPDLGPLTTATLPLSNLDQILPVPSGSNYPDRNTFGTEPKHTWCYYFEKADLARQSGDWDTVNNLGKQAISEGYGPNNLYEWIPFIEGYLHAGNWNEAQSLTIDIFNTDQGYRGALCAAWARSIEARTLSPAENETILLIQNELDCSIP